IALEDPIRGMTRLRREGVTFTKDQEKQIKTLVEHNRVMDAQKVILRQVNVEFGGQAEKVGRTLPGQWNILRETLKNVAAEQLREDRKSTRLNSSHQIISYAVFCLKKNT